MTVTSATRPAVDLTDGAFYAGDSRPSIAGCGRTSRSFGTATGWPPRRRIRPSSRPSATPSCSPTPAASGPTSRACEMMIDMDDPQHLLRRKLVNSGFTRKRVKDQESMISSLCDTLIDAVCERGECDFVWDLAAPLPMAVIGDMLGVRPEEREMFLKWSDDLVSWPEQHCGRSGYPGHHGCLRRLQRIHDGDDRQAPQGRTDRRSGQHPGARRGRRISGWRTTRSSPSRCCC